MIRRPPRATRTDTLLPYTTLFRSGRLRPLPGTVRLSADRRGMTTEVRQEELLIAVIARMLDGLRHVAVGASSPIPGAAALLTRRISGGRLRVSVLGSRANNPFTDGGRRSEERRVGKEGASTCSSRWSPSD